QVAQRLLVLALVVVEQGSLNVSNVVPRVEADGAIQVAQRLLDVSPGGVGGAAVAPGTGEVGRAMNRLVEVGDGRVVGAGREVDRPALVVSVDPLLAIAQADHLAPVGEGVIELAEIAVAAGPAAIGVEVV